MFRISFYFFLGFTISLSAQNKDFKVGVFCETELLKHVQSLSSDVFEGRRTGTDGALKAKKYIVNQFHALGVLPLITGYEQSFSFVDGRKLYKGVNVLGFVKGAEFPRDYIVVSAHYDHEGIERGDIYNGADDNASGVSALFSFAEYFKKYPPKHSILLAAFDAEELGIQGSKYFVESTIMDSKNIILNINMDMISRSDKNELFVVGASDNKVLKSLFQKEQPSTKLKLIMGHDGYDSLDNWTHSSDHANFYEKGIPFLYFGVEDHKDYHEPTDTFENIHPEFYIEAVKTIISVFENIDDSKF